MWRRGSISRNLRPRMEFAIVDIETTGGYASANGITEISVLVYNGSQVTQRFETLVNPNQPIPRYIAALTGITDEMVADAPQFNDIAQQLFAVLDGRVFVAHNVNFDYSFVKHHLDAAGYELKTNKLCTVRLSKKVFPGLPSYSLGNLCRTLDIRIEKRHRAGGDAFATVRLFEKILANGGMVHIEQALKKGSKEQYLPIHLPKDHIDRLPYTPGVYYFHDEKGKVIYVGKAKNLKYRVRSHFSHNGAGRQKQEFMRNIHSISFCECATDLMAHILETVEIKRLWPKYNTSQKRIDFQYALYQFEDQLGYKRLALDRKRKNLTPLHTFSLLWEGQQLLNKLIAAHELSPHLCFVDKTKGINIAELAIDKPAVYNQRVDKAIESLLKELPSYVLVDKGISEGEKSCILLEKGRFYGMGYVKEKSLSKPDIEKLKNKLTMYPDHLFIRSLVNSFANANPDKMIML